MEKDKRQERKQFDPRAGAQQGQGQPQQQQPPTDDASGKRSFFGRMQEVLQTNRGAQDSPAPQAPVPAPAPPVQQQQMPPRREQPVAPPQQQAPVEDAARPKMAPSSLKRMIVPEGCLIAGSLTSGTETEISGRIEGDVNVDARLYLGPTAVITGNVRAVSCRVEGSVEGKMDCSQDIELGQSGHLSADAKAGKQITIAGTVTGSAISNGVVRLVASGRVHGNIQTRRLFIEEGATFNGKCLMTTAQTQKG